MYAAKILRDSISRLDARLTTFEVTFPRIILAEVNTHRVLSRNSASSRAIPVHKQIFKVEGDPFFPEAWPTEQKGMSGGSALVGIKQGSAHIEWMLARDDAVTHANELVKMGVHKSLVNRLLEPFMWHTAIISATEWSNFFALRTDKNAQPEFRHIALMMQELLQDSDPRYVGDGGWHLPLVTDDEVGEGYPNWDPNDQNNWVRHWDYWKAVSVGRCARVSYLTHDGVRDPDADKRLHDMLMSNGHLSPFEHVATPIGNSGSFRSGNFLGWHQYRKDILYEHDFSKTVKG